MKFLKPIDSLRWIILLAAMAGTTLALDPMAADSLAPKSFWAALGLGLIPALALLRLWWGAPLRLPKGPWALALLALVIIQCLAYFISPLKLASQAPWQAWLLSIMGFVGLFDLMQDESRRPWVLRGLAVLTVAAGMASVAQAMGFDRDLAVFGTRIPGRFGNPNFAGGFFVLTLPVTVWMAWADKKWLGGLASAAALAGLLLSASKAALLGLGAEAMVAAHLFFWSAADAARKKRVLTGMAAALAGLLVVAAMVLPAASRQRLLSAGDSVSFRLNTWQGALAAWQERPLLGWGPGTFSVVYPGHRPPLALAQAVQHSYEVSHAENWPLQALVESGLLGLAACVVFLLMVLWPLRGLAYAWPSEDGAWALALLTAILGSLACNLASLDIYLPSTWLPFLVMLSLAAATRPAFTFTVNAEPYARLLVSAALILMAFAAPTQAWLRWQGSRDLAQATALSAAGRFNEAIPLYQQALRTNETSTEARYFLASALQDSGKPAEALEEFRSLRQVAPDYVLVHAKLARLYEGLGRRDEAVREWQRQLILDPYLIQAVQGLAGLYAAGGELDKLEALLSDALGRFPGQPDLQKNLAAVRRARQKGRG
jgi:O-antigen ligase